MTQSAVHPQPPHAGRSVALMSLSFAVHGLLIWGIVSYSLRPLTDFVLPAPEPAAVQVVVISAPKPSPSPSPVQPFVSPPPPTVPTPHVPAAQPRAAVAPAAVPVEQAQAPTTAPSQSQSQTLAPGLASTNATTTTNTEPIRVATVATPAEKPAEPQPTQNAHPDYAYNPPPNYPQALHEQGLGGVVWLRVWVDSDGRPGEIKLSKGSGYRMLDDAALRAVRTWRFVPAKTGDQRQSSWVEFPIRFNPNI